MKFGSVRYHFFLNVGTFSNVAWRIIINNAKPTMFMLFGIKPSYTRYLAIEFSIWLLLSLSIFGHQLNAYFLAQQMSRFKFSNNRLLKFQWLEIFPRASDFVFIFDRKSHKNWQFCIEIVCNAPLKRCSSYAIFRIIFQQQPTYANLPNSLRKSHTLVFDLFVRFMMKLKIRHFLIENKTCNHNKRNLLLQCWPLNSIHFIWLNFLCIMKDARNYFQLMICGLLLINLSAIQKRFSFQFESNASFSLSLSLSLTLQSFIRSLFEIYACVSCVSMSIHSMLPNSLETSIKLIPFCTILQCKCLIFLSFLENIDYD